MSKLRAVSGQDVEFFGYGGQWMKKEGFNQNLDIDITEMPDKQFVTYRKTKSFKESIYYRWNPLNLVNKHYTRQTDQVYDKLMDIEAPK